MSNIAQEQLYEYYSQMDRRSRSGLIIANRGFTLAALNPELEVDERQHLTESAVALVHSDRQFVKLSETDRESAFSLINAGSKYEGINFLSRGSGPRLLINILDRRLRNVDPAINRDAALLIEGLDEIFQAEMEGTIIIKPPIPPTDN